MVTIVSMTKEIVTTMEVVYMWNWCKHCNQKEMKDWEKNYKVNQKIIVVHSY